MPDFVPGQPYPIETLPDDLYDSVSPGAKWALRGANFWNDCQGWWHQSIADYWLENRYLASPIATYWSPEPPDPRQIATEGS